MDDSMWIGLIVAIVVGVLALVGGVIFMLLMAHT